MLRMRVQQKGQEFHGLVSVQGFCFFSKKKFQLKNILLLLLLKISMAKFQNRYKVFSRVREFLK